MSRFRLHTMPAQVVGLVAALVAALVALPTAAQQPNDRPPLHGSVRGPVGPRVELKTDPRVEAAIDRGLAWLTAQQKDDGSWEYDAGSVKVPTPQTTATALFAFLAAGHTHKPDVPPGNKYHVEVKAGIDFLVKSQKADGSFAGIAGGDQAWPTAVLATAYQLTGDAALKGTAQKGADKIVADQKPDGGWGFGVVSTALMLQGLEAARRAGLKVDPAVFTKAAKYLDRIATGPQKEIYPDGVGGGGSPGTLPTAAGLLARTYTGWGPESPGLAAGVAGLVKTPPTKDTLDTAYLLYAFPTVAALGGEPWATWYPKVRDVLLALQTKAGNWPPDAGPAGNYGKVPTTCHALYVLGITLRRMPLFQARGLDLTDDDLGLELIPLPDLDRVEPLVPLPDLDRVVDPPDAGLLKDDLGLPIPKDDPLKAPGPLGLTGPLGKDDPIGGGIGFGLNKFPGRSGATKDKLLRETGGTAESELAVARGLMWLAKQQKPDGSWQFDGAAKGDTIAATGMALLPFLAAGETHKVGRKYQKTVDSGLRFLVNNLHIATGKFNHKDGSIMYSHAIATIALCEAYGMTTDKEFLLRPAQAAINFIQQAQGPDGGWRYTPGMAGDTSVTGWQMQALQTARLSKDIVVNDKVIARANQFLDKVASGDRKAAFGYTDATGRPGTSLTAIGLLTRYYFAGWNPSNPGMVEGIAGLLKARPATGRVPDMYHCYYATQVMHLAGDAEWKEWNEGPMADGTRKGGVRDLLIGLQAKAGQETGSWEKDPGPIGGSCGRLGTTALCVLTLEVYYRNLPIYKSQIKPAGK